VSRHEIAVEIRSTRDFRNPLGEAINFLSIFETKSTEETPHVLPDF